MNNLLVRDVKFLDEQYRIGNGIISDDAFKQLEKLFIPVDPEPDYFNQKNNKLLPKLAKENYKEFLESLLTKTRLSIQPKIDGCAIAIRYINGNFNKAITKKGFDVSSKIKQIKNVPDCIPIKRDFQIRGELYAKNQIAGISQRITKKYLKLTWLSLLKIKISSMIMNSTYYWQKLSLISQLADFSLGLLELNQK